MDYKKDYLEVIKPLLKEKRYIHTLGVIDEAIKLSRKYNVSEDKARIAASLHDSMKYLDEEKEDYIINKYFNKYSDKKYKALYHSMTGYIYAKEELKIDDEDILNAILNHTVGRPNMSTLEKIIFVADFIDPSRGINEIHDHFEKIAYESLDKAVYEMSVFQMEEVKKKGYFIIPESLETIEYYKEHKDE